MRLCSGCTSKTTILKLSTSEAGSTPNIYLLSGEPFSCASKEISPDGNTIGLSGDVVQASNKLRLKKPWLSVVKQAPYSILYIPE